MNFIFNYYSADIKQTDSLGLINLQRFLKSIVQPRPNNCYIFEKIKECELSGDMQMKANYKMQLWSFTPCVKVRRKRRLADVIEFTGLFVLDFDHLEPDYAEEFKQFLFDKYPYIIAAWLSPSRCGVKALMCIEKANDIDEYRLYYNAIEEEFSKYNGFDSAVKNAVLPLFYSIDKNLLVRSEVQIWKKKLTKLSSEPIQQYVITDKSSNVEKIMKSAIDKINDNGHPQLRAAAYSLGGYVGAGLIDYNNAYDLICNLIDNNVYLSAKKNIYKTTAKTMIDKGSSEPLYL